MWQMKMDSEQKGTICQLHQVDNSPKFTKISIILKLSHVTIALDLGINKYLFRCYNCLKKLSFSLSLSLSLSLSRELKGKYKSATVSFLTSKCYKNYQNYLSTELVYTQIYWSELCTQSVPFLSPLSVFFICVFLNNDVFSLSLLPRTPSLSLMLLPILTLS